MLQADPSNVDIYVNLSQIYLQGKKYADAEKILQRAEDRKLDSERLKFQLATIYERQKDFDKAESIFKEVLKDNPKNAVVLNYIGYMLADRGIRLQEAVKYVEEALAIDPNNGAYLDSLGWAFFKLNDLEKAEKYLLQAVELVKNDPVIHDHLGDLYFKAGALEKARDFWSKSLNTGAGEQEDAQKVREKLEKIEESLRKQKRHP
jgi:Tfp pilus assembly protein PilF